MHIVTEKVLRTFADRNPIARAPIAHWIVTMRAAEFRTMDEVVRAFSKAKALNASRARFEIAGGDFRLIVAFNFGRGWVYVKFAGTHAEYDRVDALTVAQY